MKLRFTRRAQRHLDQIASCIAVQNPDAARRVGERIAKRSFCCGHFRKSGMKAHCRARRSSSARGCPISSCFGSTRKKIS